MARKKRPSDLDDLIAVLNKNDIKIISKLRKTGGLQNISKVPRQYRKGIDLEYLRLRPCGHLHVTILGWRVLHRLGYEELDRGKKNLYRQYTQKPWWHIL